MNFSIQTLQAYSTLVWILFLAPVFLVMWRGYILDSRAQRYGRTVSYSPLLALGFVPVVNLPVAVVCTIRTIREHRACYYNAKATW